MLAARVSDLNLAGERRRGAEGQAEDSKGAEMIKNASHGGLLRVGYDQIVSLSLHPRNAVEMDIPGVELIRKNPSADRNGPVFPDNFRRCVREPSRNLEARFRLLAAHAYGEQIRRSAVLSDRKCHRDGGTVGFDSGGIGQWRAVDHGREALYLPVERGDGGEHFRIFKQPGLMEYRPELVDKPDQTA